MDELAIRAEGETSCVTLRSPNDPFGDGYFLDIDVEIIADGLSATGWVRLDRPADAATDLDLVAFVQALADSWQGWTGAREWTALDRQLSLDASHHDEEYRPIQSSQTRTAPTNRDRPRPRPR